jgi:hypothetical protein
VRAQPQSRNVSPAALPLAMCDSVSAELLLLLTALIMNGLLAAQIGA